jgi:hypothetical protein
MSPSSPGHVTDLRTAHCCVKAKGVASPNLALWILMSSIGLSSLSVLTASNLCIVFMPEDTLPNIVCLPSRKGVGA